MPSAEWAQWVREECEERGWVGHCGDVLVWRELVKRGGRGVYVGGVREFQDYASHYHNVTPLTDSVAERNIGELSNYYIASEMCSVSLQRKRTGKPWRPINWRWSLVQSHTLSGWLLLLHLHCWHTTFFNGISVN